MKKDTYMMRRTVFYAVLALFLFSSAACKKRVSVPGQAMPEKIHKPDEKNISLTISEDTVWEGVITVDGIVKVAKGVKLTIMPGTRIEFTYHDYDKDGLGDSGLFVDEGTIVAAGTYEAPILFTAVEGHKQSGAWGMLLINFANGVVFDYCKFEYSTYTLHIHFSTGSITNNLFTGNEDGTRIGRSRFFIYNNVFKGNRVKGVNFTDSKNIIEYNTITENKHGIFLFERDKGSTISYNNIFNNRKFNFKLGDFYVGDAYASKNYWGDVTVEQACDTMYDHKFDKTLGIVYVDPVREKYAEAGIIKDLSIEKVFEFEADGYIDSSAAVDPDTSTVYFGSYDGIFYAIDANTGEERFTFDAGDIIDSSPAISGDSVYFASWNNFVYVLNKATGELKWKYQMQKSEQDDHRQSSPVIHDGVLYIGGYDGTIYALDAGTGKKRWTFATAGAVRSKGVISGDTIIFGSSDGRLYGISLADGRGAWMVDLMSPLLSTPLLTGDTVIVAAKAGMLYSIDLETKKIAKEFTTGGVNFYAAPILHRDDVIFATTDNRLYRLKKDSFAVKSVTEISGPAYATPFAYKDFLLSSTNSGNLNVIERGAAMRVIATFYAENAIQSTPLLHNDTLYIGARDNKLYALKIRIETTEKLEASPN
jgi:parallel beta-helix repeat protein